MTFDNREVKTGGLRDIESVTLAPPALPPLTQTPEVRIERLERYRKALSLGRIEFGGYQDRNIINLREFAPDVEVRIFGDLHGSMGNLQKILEHDGTWDKTVRGEILLLSLGDVIHEEERGRLHIMDNSLRLQEQVMEMKIEAPINFYDLLGNHDFLSNGVCKGGINQNAEYLAELEEQLGAKVESYVRSYKECIEKRPLLVLGNGFVALHAGPIKNHSLQEIHDAPIEDKDFFKQHSVVQQATWNRWYDQDTLTRYTSDDVEKFLQLCGSVDSELLVGHSPRREDKRVWNWELMPNHHVIFAAHSGLGYASVKDGKVKFIDVPSI